MRQWCVLSVTRAKRIVDQSRRKDAWVGLGGAHLGLLLAALATGGDGGGGDGQGGVGGPADAAVWVLAGGVVGAGCPEEAARGRRGRCVDEAGWHGADVVVVREEVEGEEEAGRGGEPRPGEVGEDDLDWDGRGRGSGRQGGGARAEKGTDEMRVCRRR